MTTPDIKTSADKLPTLRFPEKQAATIHKYADLIGADGIITLLDKLRIFVAGDLKKVFETANGFAQEGKLSRAAGTIDQQRLTLKTAWRGDAADQFDTYATLATAALTKGQTAISQLTKSMAAIAAAVVKTYSDILEAIFKCAINLGQLGGKVLITLGTTVFPPLIPAAIKELADTVNNAFAQFWRDCLALMTGMIATITTEATTALDFTTIETTFPSLPDVGTSATVMDNPGRWHIKPGADPS
ncbi:hypothetical protein [Amycolatopsis samaneae]|uniref:Uncharacterized protein n=1 Tax=Amycolatopsis samaneae TaxID=664691 RepID=A0ABW5G926_9PSEU